MLFNRNEGLYPPAAPEFEVWIADEVLGNPVPAFERTFPLIDDARTYAWQLAAKFNFEVEEY